MKPYAVAIQSGFIKSVAIKTDNESFKIGAGQATPIIATTVGTTKDEVIGKIALDTKIPKELLIAFELVI